MKKLSAVCLWALLGTGVVGEQTSAYFQAVALDQMTSMPDRIETKVFYRMFYQQ